MMTRGGEGGKKCRKFDDVICERPLSDEPAENLCHPSVCGQLRTTVCYFLFNLSYMALIIIILIVFILIITADYYLVIVIYICRFPFRIVF